MTNIKEPNVWDFVEKYYPNYHDSEEIAHNSDLCKLVDNEFEATEDDSAYLKLIENYGGNKDNPKIEKDLIYSTECIYRESILNYLKNNPL